MDADTLLGCIIVAVALGLVTFLVLWSRRSIRRIARNGLGSVRELHREPGDES